MLQTQTKTWHFIWHIPINVIIYIMIPRLFLSLKSAIITPMLIKYTKFMSKDRSLGTFKAMMSIKWHKIWLFNCQIWTIKCFIWEQNSLQDTSYQIIYRYVLFFNILTIHTYLHILTLKNEEKNFFCCFFYFYCFFFSFFVVAIWDPKFTFKVWVLLPCLQLQLWFHPKKYHQKQLVHSLP